MRSLGIFLLLAATLLGSAVGAELDGQPGVLVFKNGDRLVGHLTAEGVFRSARFGEVRFAPGEARFEPGDRTAGDDTSGGLRARIEELITGRPRTATALHESAQQHAKADAPPSTPAPTGPGTVTIVSGTQPGPGTASEPLNRPWWHPWRLSISGYLDRTKESGVPRDEYFGGLRLQHPRTEGLTFVADARYEFVRKNARIDKRRGTLRGDVRLDLDHGWFALYEPFAEYDGRNVSAQPDGRTRINYLVVQQQAGLGFRLLDAKRLQSQLAFTWSYFDFREFHGVSSHHHAPALVFENELFLPWGFEVKQTGDLYYVGHLRNETVGLENHLDLTKRFGNYLFLTLRHEYRRDYPVPRTNPLQRTRLIFGVNF